MKFSNLLYTSILQNLSFIIMVALGFKTFNFSIKWLILLGIIGIYAKYELTKRNIISNDNPSHIPYTNKLVDLIQKIRQFKPYNEELIEKIITDLNHYFFIHSQINNNINLQYCNQYVEKMDSKLNLILNNFNSMVHLIQNNSILKKYHNIVLNEIKTSLIPYYRISFNKCIAVMSKNVDSSMRIPQTYQTRVAPSNKYSINGNNFNIS